MPNPASAREQRLRKTKAQLIDEIDTLERRVAATSEGGSELKRREQDLAEKESQLRVALDNMPGGMMLVDLARFPSENPNPVLRVMPDGAVLYVNEAAIAVKGDRKSVV